MRIIFTRRQMCVFAILTFLAGPTIAVDRSFAIEVLKSPTCGCCKDWIAHLQENGFSVKAKAKANDTGNNGIRQRLGMPIEYGVCHTAQISGYVAEGHVPAADIVRLLKERPKAVGLAVPRMPIGSPGMDGPAYGGRQDPYEVLLVKRDGSANVFLSHR